MPLAKHEAQIRKLSPSRKPSSPALLPQGEGRKEKISRLLFPGLLQTPSATDRHVDQYFRTLVYATIYFQCTADLLRAFLHADQAKVFCLAIRRLLIIKTVSVISHT